jgi:hypothetical protein
MFQVLSLPFLLITGCVFPAPYDEAVAIGVFFFLPSAAAHTKTFQDWSTSPHGATTTCCSAGPVLQGRAQRKSR